MSTIIYPSPIFGPVHSRRLGVSLGINLMPDDGKICTFDCIYCECGYNHDFRPRHRRPTRREVAEGLEAKLRDMQARGETLDDITFAGNGEPTAHPQFRWIMEDTIRIKSQYFPKAKVSVLSNSTFIDRPDVHAALMMADNNILKLDTVSDEYIHMVDRPTYSGYKVDNIIRDLKSFRGHVIIQSMFMKGETDEGQSVDNTGEEYVGPWLEAIKAIAPEKVMVYTIDRETPDQHLLKATHAELDAIRDRVIALGIPCTASY